MRSATEENPETSRIMLGLLGAVEQDRVHSHRRLASAGRSLPYHLTPRWLTITDVPGRLRVRIREQGGAAK